MKTKKIITSVVFILASLTTLYAQPVEEFLKVIAENNNPNSTLRQDRNLYDNFGISVSISGNYAIVGSYNDNDENGATSIKDAGAAYIFERLTSSAPWLFKQKLVASDRAKGDAFGLVAISGNYAIVGASGEDHKVSVGAFEKDVGAAYIFEREGISPYEWKEVKKIVAPDGAAGDYFGGSVSISGDYIIVGAAWDGPREPNYGFGTGAAYIFERDGNGVWFFTQKLQAFDKAEGDLFGSVSISGNYAIVGAFLEDEDTTGGSGSLSNAGSAYIFDRNSSHPPGYMGAWSIKPRKIVAPDRESEDRFGYSVAISGSFAIVGAANEDMTVNDDWAGAAYIFERDALGNWNKGQKITSSTRANGEEFGIGVAINGNYAIVGAYRSGNLNSGMAYVFERKIGPPIGPVGAWNFNSKIFSSDLADYDNFGRYVAISGCSALIGARFEEEDVLGGNTIVRAGSAYFFECEKPPTPKLCCDIPDVDITLNRVGKTDKFNLNINSAN
ncbi:MAG: FG-GAP repeat protein, partial [Altibacter sp.]|uniref:FG-GAP repeat protein n=1 Tax=Altibacter sp. TaxID=2024823 RepID=UPI001DF3B683